MSEKDVYFLIFVGASILWAVICLIGSKISDKRFEKKYLKPKRTATKAAAQKANNK